jgi:predicted phosphodiesterase
MRIQLVSDLHLERYPDFVPQAAEGVELLVLAGDIGSYQARSQLGGDDFGLARFSPRAPGSPWPRVLYLPGNHEFDGLEYEPTYARLRALCEDLGIEWLENETVTMGGVRFIGSTLWADFDAYAQGEPDLTRQLKARDKAFRAANFYLSKFTTLRDGVPQLAEQIRELSLQSQAWLRSALATPFDGRTVAVTHFAPTLRSADPRYGHSAGTAGFCNALDDLLELADVWMHGHLHCPHDYVVPTARGGCRVLANPRGYFSKGEQAGFREAFVLDLD